MGLLKDLTDIQSELKAPKGQFNKFAGYNYRSCEDIIEVVKPLLSKYGITMTLSDDIIHFPSNKQEKFNIKETKIDYKTKNIISETNNDIIVGGDRFYVKSTCLLQKGDEKISTSAFAREAETKKGMDESQITGAASSYARKYALNGMFAIDDEKDADTKDNSSKPQIGQQDTAPKHFSQVILKKLSDKVKNGKYEGKTWQEIIDIDMNYFKWILDTQIKDKKPNNFSAEIMHYYESKLKANNLPKDIKDKIDMTKQIMNSSTETVEPNYDEANKLFK